MWLLDHTKQLHMPPQSPDLNPIEHLWAHLEKQVLQHQLSSKKQLKEVLRGEWQKIAPKFCKKLTDSMPKRFDEVFEHMELHTKH